MGYAITGAWRLLCTEASIQAQFAIAIVVTFAGFYFDITITEWIIQTICIGLIMSLEGMNTAVESLADYIQPDHDPKIGHLKDIAAGAVFITAIVAVIVGLIIYIPYINNLL